MSQDPVTTFGPRGLKPGQRCEVWVASVVTGERKLIFSTEDLLLEAPNWAPDNSALILNGAGLLWRLDLASASIGQIPLEDIPDLNNDHVLAPNGENIYLSANDGHIYRAGIGGGSTVRITADDGYFHFLHGISPDELELAYVAIAAGDFTQPGRLMTMPVVGGPSTLIATGPGHCDGPEYSPDGEWIYFNTESYSASPGHAQIARVGVAGRGAEQLIKSETVDWFPHVSSNGRLVSYLRFPPGTLGHPADLPVDVVVITVDAWKTPLHSWPTVGGQGTLNVNSWSPDSTQLAYVAYPIDVD